MRCVELQHHEPRWPAFCAFAAIALVSFSQPAELTFGPRWVAIAIVAVLVIPGAIAHSAGQIRFAHILLTGAQILMTLSLVASVVLLIRSLAPRSIPPVVLLRSSAALWASNILIFALWYWRLDAGGPNERATRDHHETGAFLFPQMAMELDEPWRPHFVDYLFLAFNTSTALSPADTQVLSRWAKLLMMLQASVSFTVIVILTARSVNIL